MQVKHGSYTGNGSAGHAITGVGFAPDLLIIRRTGSTNVGTINNYFTVRASAAGNAVTFRADTAYETGIITSLDSDGFTVNTSEMANFNGDTYFYIAVRDNGAKDFACGIYTGNGNDGKLIDIGFRPDFVVAKANSAITGSYSFSSKTTFPSSFQWWSGACRDDLIVAMTGKGFIVNNGSASGANEVNVNGVEHMYFAFKNVYNLCGVMNYKGDGTDNRNISLPTFLSGMTPVFGLVKGDSSGGKMVFKFKQNAGDTIQEPDNSVVWNNCIQSFGVGTFQVGSDVRANESGTNFSLFILADDFTTTTSATQQARQQSLKPRPFAPPSSKG